MKIQNVPLKPKETITKDFCETLKKLKVGQSFLFTDLQNNYRKIITLAQYFLNREFRTQREGRQYRVGRIK